MSREAAVDESVQTSEDRLVCTESRVIALDEDTRRVKHVISTGRLDRGNRIVEPAGWRLAAYRANPVVMADHDYSIEKIIGKAVETKVEGAALVSTTEFDKEGLGNLAFRLVQAGFARAWSVGWRGVKSHRIGEAEDCETCKAAGKVDFGRHFVQQELLEYSLVAIPANPEAVMGLQAAGLVDASDVEAWSGLAASVPEIPSPQPEVEEPAPQRSSEFYQVLFSARRDNARRVAALRASQRIRR